MKKNDNTKHIFVINPTAGSGEGIKLYRLIHQSISISNVDAHIYETNSAGDGEAYSKMACTQKGSDKKLRFYACGGDGTLNEVLNGVVGFENVEVGCVPVGSGNDFIRNFGKKEQFLDISRQLSAPSKECDIIELTSKFDGEKLTKYAANVISVGFDAAVAATMHNLKKTTPLKGSALYNVSLAKNFVFKKSTYATVYVDGKKIYDDRLLFSSICNGKYFGGGMKGMPFADPNDGELDINVIFNISRARFLKVVSKFIAGEHMEVKGIDEILHYQRAKEIDIIPKVLPLNIGIDGEPYKSSSINIKISKHKLNFITPSA